MCQTVMTSKGWKRKKEITTGWVLGQRYYCVKCGAAYKTKRGCVVQLKLQGHSTVSYMRAEVPNEDTLDLMAMRAERKYFQTGMGANQLFGPLPELAPESTSFLAPFGETVITYTDRELVDTLPMYKWVDILTYVKEGR